VFEGEGRVAEYVGGYTDWIRQRPQIDKSSVSKSPVSKSSVSKSSVSKGAAGNTSVKTPETANAEKVKRASTKLSYKLQRELDALPQEIELAENEVEAQQAICAAPDFYQGDHENVAAQLDRLAQLEQRLESLMERWVELEAMQEGE